MCVHAWVCVYTYTYVYPHIHIYLAKAVSSTRTVRPTADSSAAAQQPLFNRHNTFRNATLQRTQTSHACLAAEVERGVRVDQEGWAEADQPSTLSTSAVINHR